VVKGLLGPCEAEQTLDTARQIQQCEETQEEPTHENGTQQQHDNMQEGVGMALQTMLGPN